MHVKKQNIQTTDANSLCTHTQQTQGDNLDSHDPALLNTVKTGKDVRSTQLVTYLLSGLFGTTRVLPVTPGSSRTRQSEEVCTVPACLFLSPDLATQVLSSLLENPA